LAQARSMFARDARSRVRGAGVLGERPVSAPRPSLAADRPRRASASRENVAAFELNRLAGREGAGVTAGPGSKPGAKGPGPRALDVAKLGSLPARRGPGALAGTLPSRDVLGTRARSPGPGALRRTNSSHALSSTFAAPERTASSTQPGGRADRAGAAPQPADSRATQPSRLPGARRPASAKSSHADALELEVSLTEGLREVRSRDLEADQRGARLPNAMTPANLRIYEELFDAIIERDKVFGGLLRKVKSAYTAYLGALDPSAGAASDAAETAALRAENAELKQLVERLHAEMTRAGGYAADPSAHATSPSPIRAEDTPSPWLAPASARSEESSHLAPDGPGSRAHAGQGGSVARPFTRPKSVPSLNLAHVQQLAATARTDSSGPALSLGDDQLSEGPQSF